MRRATTRPRVACLVLVLLGGCALGPNYRRPELDPPEVTRGQPAPTDPESIADLPWWGVFRDPALQALVVEAIAESHDLRAAAARVEEARNQIVIARADMLPQAGYE